jgi:hypothetical protein
VTLQPNVRYRLLANGRRSAATGGVFRIKVDAGTTNLATLAWTETGYTAKNVNFNNGTGTSATVTLERDATGAEKGYADEIYLIPLN